MSNTRGIVKGVIFTFTKFIDESIIECDDTNISTSVYVTDENTIVIKYFLYSSRVSFMIIVDDDELTVTYEDKVILTVNKNNDKEMSRSIIIHTVKLLCEKLK